MSFHGAFLRACALVCLAVATAAPAFAERLALIVANSDYATLPKLKNPVNDAALLAAKLDAAHFKVTVVKDADRTAFMTAVQQFARTVSAAGASAEVVFYYAGHGLQDDQQRNYLVPVDANLQAQTDLPIGAITSESILETLDRARPKIAFVILDACRNNPLPATRRGSANGLGLENQRAGFLIAFSTKPGAVAEDGAGQNSPYAEALASEMAQPGDAETVFRKVRVRVLEQTAGRQQPWETTSLTMGFSFADGAAAPDPKPAPVKASDKPVDVREPAPAPDPIVAFGEAVRIDTIEGYQRVLKEFPNHPKRDTIASLMQRKQAEGLWDEIQRAPLDRDKIAKCELMSTAYRDSAYADRCQQLRTALLAKAMTGAPTPAPARVEPPVASFYYVAGLDPNGDNWLALRSAPSFKSGWSQTKMGPGTLLTKLGQDGEWMNVRLQNGETGWANSRYVACCRAGGAPSSFTQPQVVQPRPQPQGGGFYYVTGLDPNGDNWLALRDAPSLKSGWSTTRMGPGTLLTKIGQSGEWMNVRLQNGETGWANARYIACCRGGSPAPQPASSGGGSFYYVTGLDPDGDNWLALRDAPSKRSSWSTTRMGPGTLLIKLGQQGEWMNVRLQSGETGWANARFIACCRSR